MPFIGIIAKENDCNFIKNNILKNAVFNKFEVINLNKKTLENVKNVKFEVLVVNENIKELLDKSKYLEDIIIQASYIIINSDIKNDIKLLKLKGTNIITYGFNAKSTITISSIKEEKVLLCIQRKIERVDKTIIEEQEINVKVDKNNIKKLYNMLIIFTILAIYGEKLKKI